MAEQNMKTPSAPRAESGSALDRILIASSYLYLVIPIVVFLFGWLRPLLAISVTALLLLGTWRTLRGFGYSQQSGLGRPGFLVPSLLIVLAWVLLSGIDGFGLQNGDFDARNAIFRDLIQRPWPVRYEYGASALLRGVVGDTGALVYYFAYWLPPALVGKLLGWDAANHALFLWSILGVFLSTLLVCRYNGTFTLVTLLALVCWSGMDIVGTLLYSPPPSMLAVLHGGSVHIREVVGQTLAIILGRENIEWWVSANTGLLLWQYSSFTTQLFYVFNQAIPAWVATALLLNQQDKKSLIHTYSLILLFAPLPAIGLLPFLVYRLAERSAWMSPSGSRGTAPSFLRQVMSIQNTVAPASLGLVAVAFLGTQHSQPGQGAIWNFIPVSADLVIRYLEFCGFEFALLGLLVLRSSKERRLTALALMILFILPLYRSGATSDLVMRASIPALLVLFMTGIRSLQSETSNPALGPRLLRVLLGVVLLLGVDTPLHEIGRSTYAIVQSGGTPAPQDKWLTLGVTGNLSKDLENLPHFVLSEPQGTFFFNFLARP
jgi:hypothetical protein